MEYAKFFHYLDDKVFCLSKTGKCALSQSYLNHVRVKVEDITLALFAILPSSEYQLGKSL